MPTEDIPQPDIQMPEGLEQQPVETPQPAPEPEPYRFKYRGEEREVPREKVDGFAEVLGTTPQGVINLLQRAREADRIYADRDRLAQELEAERQRNRGYQPPAPQPYSQPQYPPTPAYTPPQDAPDPIAILQNLQRQVNEIKELTMHERQQFMSQFKEQQEIREAQRIESIADQFLQDHNKGRKNPVSREEFLEEIQLSGLHMSPLPMERVFDRAWRLITYDEAAPAAQKQIMDQLRDPRAKVVVPGASNVTPTAPAPQGLEGQFGDMKWGDMIQNLPERR